MPKNKGDYSMSFLRTVSVFVFLFVSSVSFATEGFIAFDDLADQSRRQLVISCLEAEFDNDAIPVQIFDRNSDECFLTLDNGLYYVHLGNSFVKRLLHTQSPILSFKMIQLDSGNLAFLFNTQNMSRGIIRDYYGILVVFAGRSFKTGDCYEMISFDRDSEDGGKRLLKRRRGIKSQHHETLTKTPTPEIILAVRHLNYTDKSEKKMIHIFKKNDEEYAKWREGTLLY